jgi:hypothetical protein
MKTINQQSKTDNQKSIPKAQPGIPQQTDTTNLAKTPWTPNGTSFIHFFAITGPVKHFPANPKKANSDQYVKIADTSLHSVSPF